MDRSSISPTPQQLRALTHPARLRMLGILRAEGSQTATALATRLGVNTGAASYHLRQLATHGFIVDDEERGNGRERWWKAAHASTRTELEDSPDPDDQEALDAYLQSVVTVYTQHLQQAVEARSTMSEEWRRAMTFSDWRFTLTPARAERLIEWLSEELDGYDDEDPADAADAGDEEGAATPFVVMLNAYPRPGSLL